tara:strand:+ start:133 stop:1146 length:1014 start_codon:yes stop_codon:yes gene_type:complete
MFDKIIVEASIDRIMNEPSFDDKSVTVKSIRKQLESELRIKFDSEEKAIVKELLKKKLVSTPEPPPEKGSATTTQPITKKIAMNHSVESRLMMMLGFVPVPEGMGRLVGRKRSNSSNDGNSSSSSSSISNNRNTSSKRPRVEEKDDDNGNSNVNGDRSLLDRANVKKAEGDACFTSDKLKALPLYVTAQLLRVEHVDNAMVEDQDEEDEIQSQELLEKAIKTLKFCAKIYIQHGQKSQGAIVHAYRAVVQMRYMRCRWDHYNVAHKNLAKNLTESKPLNREKAQDMITGVGHMFEAFRSWKAAIAADNKIAKRLSNWSVVSVKEANAIVNEILALRR